MSLTTLAPLAGPHRVPRRTRRAARRAARRDERGLSTAEYAVGTLGACSIAGILVKIASSDWFGDLVRLVVETALKVLL